VSRQDSVLIVLVNWKRGADTCACLASLERLTFSSWSVVVCDNGSPDGSGGEVSNFLTSRYKWTLSEVCARNTTLIEHFGDDSRNEPRVTLVHSPENLGFAGGNNLAYRCAPTAATADYVWFLNNDTEVCENTLEALLARATEDASIGICGATLVYAHDRRTVQALGGATYRVATGAIRELGQGLQWPCEVAGEDIESQLTYVSGASMLVSRAFLDRVGLMSEDYFLYYEELDWAERGRRAGFRLAYAPAAVVYHKEGAVLGSGASAQRSPLAEYYGLRNRLRVTRKFYPWALPGVYLFSCAQVGRRLIQGKWARARMMMAVLLGFRRTAPGAGR